MKKLILSFFLFAPFLSLAQNHNYKLQYDTVIITNPGNLRVDGKTQLKGKTTYTSGRPKAALELAYWQKIDSLFQPIGDYIHNISPGASEAKSFNLSGSNSIGQGGDLSIYSTSDQITNYGRLRVYGSSSGFLSGTFAGDQFYIGTERAGTYATYPRIILGTSANNFVSVNSNSVGNGPTLDTRKVALNMSAGMSSIGGQFINRVSFSADGQQTSNAISTSLNVDGSNTANWLAGSTNHPSLVGVGTTVSTVTGGTGIIDKGAAFFGTGTSNGTKFNQFNLFDLTFGYSSGNGQITYAVGIRDAQFNAGVNGTGIFFTNSDSELPPTGYWTIYNNTGYKNYLGSGATLVNTTIDNGIDKLQIAGSTATSTLNISATDGTGYLYLPVQSSIPTAPTTGAKLFWNTSGFGIQRPTGFTSMFLGTSLTASQVYTLPNATGTITLNEATQTLINKSINFTGAGNTATNIPNSALTNSSFNYSIGTTGTDVNLSATLVSLGSSIQLNIPTASASNRGVLSASDWTAFNNKYNTPTTTLGDIIYRGASADTRLPGNTTTKQMFLTQTGTGTASAAPAYLDLFGNANTWMGMNTYMGTISSVSGTARGFYINNTLQATANNDNLYSLDIAGTRGILGGNALSGTQNIVNSGNGYTNGTYSNVTATSISGSGSGALFNVVVSGGVVTAVSANNANGQGSGYALTDQYTITSAQIGGTGSGLVFSPTNASLIYSGTTLYSIRVANSIIPSIAQGASLGSTTNYFNFVYTSGLRVQTIGALSSNLGFTNAGTTIYGNLASSGNWQFGTGNTTDAGYKLDITATTTSTNGAFRSTGITQGSLSTLIGNTFSNTLNPVNNNQTVIGADFSFTFGGGTALTTGIINPTNYTVTGTPTANGTVSGGQLSTSGSGTGMTVSIVISGLTVTQVSVVSGGSGYAVGNTLTFVANGATIVYTVPAGGLGLSGINTLAARFGNKVQFTPTTLVTTPIANDFEWDNSRFYATNASGTRNTFSYLSDISSAIDNQTPISASYTITATDFVSGKGPSLDIEANATSGNITVTLPSAATYKGYTIYVTKIDNSVNTVTINTVSGSNTETSQWQSRTFKSNGSVWSNR